MLYLDLAPSSNFRFSLHNVTLFDPFRITGTTIAPFEFEQLKEDSKEWKSTNIVALVRLTTGPHIDRLHEAASPQVFTAFGVNFGFLDEDSSIFNARPITHKSMRLLHNAIESHHIHPKDLAISLCGRLLFTSELKLEMPNQSFNDFHARFNWSGTETELVDGNVSQGAACLNPPEQFFVVAAQKAVDPEELKLTAYKAAMNGLRFMEMVKFMQGIDPESGAEFSASLNRAIGNQMSDEGRRLAENLTAAALSKSSGSSVH